MNEQSLLLLQIQPMRAFLITEAEKIEAFDDKGALPYIKGEEERQKKERKALKKAKKEEEKEAAAAVKEGAAGNKDSSSGPKEKALTWSCLTASPRRHSLRKHHGSGAL